MRSIQILGLLLCLTLSAQADVTTPAITTRDVTLRDFNPRKSHWLAMFGFEGMKYELPLNFPGDRQGFKPRQQELWGGRLGVGGELYLGAGFMTTTRVEGYFMGTVRMQERTVDPPLGQTGVSTLKQHGQIWGGDVTQSLSYLFDVKIKNPIIETYHPMTLEPFIEVGVGRAKGFNKVNYFYDTGAVDEAYRHRFEDDILVGRLGGGFNVTSNLGYFLFVRGTWSNFKITDRKESGFTRRTGQPESPIVADQNFDDTMSMVVYTIGGGYKF
jgi:hypothetical protein